MFNHAGSIWESVYASQCREEGDGPEEAEEEAEQMAMALKADGVKYRDDLVIHVTSREQMQVR